MTKKEAIKLFRKFYRTEYLPWIKRHGYLPTQRFIMWRLYINNEDYPVAKEMPPGIRNGWKNPF